VDDFILKYQDITQVKYIIEQLRPKFHVKDEGEPTTFLGQEVSMDEEKIFVNQASYARSILDSFGYTNAKPTKTPANANASTLDKNTNASTSTLASKNMNMIVGGLPWLAINTRPDIAYATSKLAQQVNEPTKETYQQASRILRYLRGSIDLGITFPRTGPSIKTGLVGYVDADYAGDVTDRKSQSGYMFFYNGGLITWTSKKQKTVAQSSTESELVAANAAAREAMWARSLLSQISRAQPGPTTIYEDNQGVIFLCKTSMAGQRAKHIDVQYHYVKDLVKAKCVQLVKIGTKEQVADILTKALTPQTFLYLANKLFSASGMIW